MTLEVRAPLLPGLRLLELLSNPELFRLLETDATVLAQP